MVIALAWLAIAWAAGHFTFGVLQRWAEHGQNLPSFNIYAYAYPHFLYWVRAVEQGHGLLWNSLQNSGQPFPGVISTSLFLSAERPFLVLPTDLALYCTCRIGYLKSLGPTAGCPG